MVHILIVEDSPLLANAFQVLFEAHGYRVSTANDIAAGIERATKESVDIMLLDLTLPDGDGLSLLSLLREREALPTTTIALTGHEDDATRERCLAAGCRQVLVKPVPAQDLLAVVRAL
jgi:DNA-binding response OmpR family regulator